MSTIVMRIENANSRVGVFQSGAAYRATQAAQDANKEIFIPSPAEHPTPYGDGIADFQMSVDYCACRSVDEIREWFHPAVLRQLARMGNRLALYETEAVKHGGVQCAFPIAKARFIGFRPLPVSRKAA